MTCAACCSRPIAPGKRRYCSDCSRRASALWKRRQRAAWKAEWEAAGRTGTDPRLDGWESAEARRAWRREYMRRWRRKRAAAPGEALARAA
ncbi:MAG TPA: hypothetical protein PLL76_19420 [Thermoanaerobaculia bacterium]|mgnify:CR=1 FL=1|jgi:hypothetical protein|nr:hypothetical protein [Thermoanaerobaculia bacterium]HQP88425.1 hypothetical protein [Thermoanaerobaculia bacterium]